MFTTQADKRANTIAEKLGTTLNATVEPTTNTEVLDQQLKTVATTIDVNKPTVENKNDSTEKNPEPAKAEVKQETKKEEAKPEDSKKPESKKEEVEEMEGVPDLDEEDQRYMAELYGEAQEQIESTENTKTSEPKSKKKEKPSEDIEPLKTKASEYDSLLSDPLIKALVDFRKNGGNNINEFVKQTGIVDVESMSPEQLYEADLKTLGLTPEEITDEMDKFGSFSKAEKLRATKGIKESLIQERDEKLNAFSANVNKEQAQHDAFMNKAIERGTQELSDTLAKMENKKYKGLLITPEMVNEVKEFVSSNTVPKIEDGQFVGYDIHESVRRAILIKYEKELLMANHKMGKLYGTDKALKLRQRPNRVETVSTVVPSQKTSIKDEVKSAAKELKELRSGARLVN